MKKEMVSKAVKLTNLQLRQHNTLLRKNLRRIVSCSTDNEKAQERMDEIETLVFNAPTLKEMFDAIVTQGRRIFDINVISVLLENELKEFYPEEYHDGGRSVFLESEYINFTDIKEIAWRFGDGGDPVLNGYLRRGAEKFFPNAKSRRIRSEALAPLNNGRRIVGVISFGSWDQTRFLDGYGSRFLKRFSRIVTVKVEMFRALGPHWSGENTEL